MSYASAMKSTQMEQAKANQVKNNAAGFVFKLEPFKQLERFLILGSDSNTYYQTARALTRENARVVEQCYALDVDKTIGTIVSISKDGRAPKNDPAIFALALGTIQENVKARQAVYANLFHVCRTGTHLFQFVSLCRELGKGWGRGMDKAVENFYVNTPLDSLAYGMMKYRSRHDYDHKRLLRLTKPVVKGDEARVNLFRYVVGKEFDYNSLPVIVRNFIDLQAEGSKTLDILKSNTDIPWELLPTQALNDPDVWRLLLPGMKMTAMMRNLGKMSSLGVLKPLSKEEALVIKAFNNPEMIRKSRLHPMNILFAQKTYASGRGFRGDNTWPVNKEVVSALENAFYLSFGDLKPGKKRTFIGLDVSGSMSSAIANTNIQTREAAAAMLMVTYKQEPQVFVRGFTATGGGYGRGTALTDLGLSRNDTLPDVQKKTYNGNYGRTDCSLPMEFAIENKLEVDQFVIYTDNETYAGKRHPYEALKAYRKAMGINAKCVVVGMTSTGFTIADPSDPGMLDVVGFDTSAPAIIADF